MSKRMIPAKTVFVCDACAVEVDFHSDRGFPPFWSRLLLRQATPAGENSRIDRELCPDCVEKVERAIEQGLAS